MNTKLSAVAGWEPAYVFSGRELTAWRRNGWVAGVVASDRTVYYPLEQGGACEVWLWTIRLAPQRPLHIFKLSRHKSPHEALEACRKALLDGSIQEKITEVEAMEALGR